MAICDTYSLVTEETSFGDELLLATHANKSLSSVMSHVIFQVFPHVEAVVAFAASVAVDPAVHFQMSCETGSREEGFLAHVADIGGIFFPRNTHRLLFIGRVKNLEEEHTKLQY